MSSKNKINSFSIIIPVYNKERYLKKTINSIVSQGYPSYEIVIVDDGSTDRSIGVLEQFRDFPIIFFSQTNQGPSSARNFGVKKAKGEWCLFLDADDELLPNTLSTFNNLINSFVGYNVYVGNYYINNGSKYILHSTDIRMGEVKSNFRAFFKNRLPMRAGSVVIKKTVLEQYPQREDLRRYEDLESLLNIMRHKKICCTDAPVMVYNIECAQTSQRRKTIKEDFLGSLSFQGKSFWERAILWSLYEQALKIYPDEIKTIKSFSRISMIDVRAYFFCARLFSSFVSWFKNMSKA